MTIGHIPEWIAIDDKLPEQGVRVLVCYDSTCIEDAIEICWFDGKVWWIDKNKALDSLYTKVHHWMSLPIIPF